VLLWVIEWRGVVISNNRFGQRFGPILKGQIVPKLPIKITTPLVVINQNSTVLRYV